MENTSKVAIVTGASSGLGRAIAIEYAAQGWRVICGDLQCNAPGGESKSTEDMIKDTGVGDASFVRVDVSDSGSVQSLIRSAVALYGRLDILVNNAGISLESYNKLGPKPIADTEDSTFDKTMAVNARSIFLGCKYAIRQFLAQEPRQSGDRGWIINIASVYGLRAEVEHVSYCASKAAVVHMTKCIARENAPSKVHCNAICPGFVKTVMDSKLYVDEGLADAAKALHPWGTLGDAKDIAKAVVFLASENASWVTGVALPVDGGYMLLRKSHGNEMNSFSHSAPVTDLNECPRAPAARKNPRHAGPLTLAKPGLSPLGTRSQKRPSKSIKNRTGCEQCKRRKVKCDEKKPVCSRCEARQETCTGNFHMDQWQIERPWITTHQASLPLPALENESLRYWYDTACLSMAMFPPPVNPLSYSLASLLRRSKAPRHTVQCVADAHRAEFAASSITRALQERNLAIVSLQGEVSRLQSPSRNQVLMRTIILSSLILCVSSNWLDPSSKEFGREFLVGVKGIIRMLLEDVPTDSFAFYVLGFFLYCEAFSSCLTPTPLQSPPDETITRILRRQPFNSLVHPITGLSTSLCPIITEIGHYYRNVIDSHSHCPDRERDLRTRLWAWAPPEDGFSLPQLVQLAEGYRNLGDIMLYQARRVVSHLDDLDSMMLTDKVDAVMETMKHIPKDDVLLNWTGPLLMIAGSEVAATSLEHRQLVEANTLRLVSLTKVQTYNLSLDLVKEL